MTTYNAIHACAVALLSGAVLQVGGISAGRGLVVDWRTVRSGETIQDGGDAFDTAQLFVSLVGAELALSVLEPDAVPEATPAPRVAPRITAWSPNEHGQRVRSFEAPGGFKVSVQSTDYGADDDDAAAAFTERLAALAETMA